MDKKSKIILILLVITLLSLSSYASLSRFSKGINKEGSINTTEMEYCKLNEIDSFSECLIRNDSNQELSLALNTIDDRTSRVDFNKIEPTNIYIPTTSYENISDKTSLASICVTPSGDFTYIVESKLINPFDVNDNEIEKITFNEETGFYTYTNSLVGSINDIVTTEEDMANGIYKYTCLNNNPVGNCSELYLFTEKAYLISDRYRFKEGYTYSYELTDTADMNAGLYKGEDDYTINDSNYTYYYRGDVKNNWVKFGNYLWRVVRINGNGTIRLIYSGLESSNHTGTSAQIGTSNFGDTQSFTASTKDLFDSTKNITMTYSNGRYNYSNVGYMYNPSKIKTIYPNKTLSASSSLDTFPTFSSISDSITYYFFKNFNSEEDCFNGDGTSDNGACILTCRKLGNDGEDDVDCVYSNWSTLATKEGNYSTTFPGVYPVTNPTQYVYTSEYKYTCWAYGQPVTRENSDGTTSVYITCPTVSEIVGVIKNQTSQAKVKYHGFLSPNIASANQNEKNSKIKTTIETWYKNNILNEKDENNNYLEEYLSDGIFCNDRSSDSTDFPLTNNKSYYYRPYNRNMATNKVPSFKCPNISNDGFTLKTSDTESRVVASGIGNNMLTYPVALITIDEVAFAGGKYGSMNHKYYLYTGENYWTMSPYYFSANNSQAYLWHVYSTGYLTAYISSYNYGVRPVINLKSDILYKSGNGTESNPYIIEPNS